jgi:hypothetical protein
MVIPLCFSLPLEYNTLLNTCKVKIKTVVKEKTTKQNKKETKPSSQKNNETTQKGKTGNKEVTTAKKVKKSKKNKNNKNNKSKLSTVTTSATDAYAAAASATHLHADKPTAKITSTSSSKKTCTITIECKSILDNMDDLKSGHEAYVPKKRYYFE